MKDFDRWNRAKKKIENDPNNYSLANERQIWWASLGINIGDEEDGKHDLFERPILIVKKFNKRIAWVVPLSTKPGHPKYYREITCNGQVSFAIISQLRLLSMKRLHRFVGKVSSGQVERIKRCLIYLLR